MTDFSCVWQTYPILYDEDKRNKLFSSDYNGALAHMKQCYEDMASALHLTVEEVKARHVKYRDSVTKAVKQYADDLRQGTCAVPTAAVTKLSVFHWLLPFSTHYDAAIMEGQNLDQYVERILRGHANKLDRYKVDSTDVRDTLSKVSCYLRDAGKPRKLVLTADKLHWSQLPCLAVEHRVTFLHGYSPMTVFLDESECCVWWDTVSVSDLPFSVSSWLSRNIDPTFNWHQAGMEHFSIHVTVSVHPADGKNAVVKRSDATALALNWAAAACKEARLTIDKARSHENLYVKSFCYRYAVACCGGSMPASEAAHAAQMETATLRLLMDDVLVVMQKVLHLEEACDKVSQTPARSVTYNPLLFRALQAAWSKSKIYSSQFWNLPKWC